MSCVREGFIWCPKLLLAEIARVNEVESRIVGEAVAVRRTYVKNEH